MPDIHSIKVLLIIVGLALWLAPLTGWATRLNDVGKFTYIVALAAYLWFR